MREGGRRPRERCDRVPSGMPQWTVLGSTSFPGAAECGRARAAALCAERRPSFCWNLDMSAGASAALRTGMPGNKTGAQLQSVGPTQAPWPPARLCEAGAVAAVSLGGEPRPLTAAGCQPPLSAAEGAVITTARAERRLHSTRVPGSTSTGGGGTGKTKGQPSRSGCFTAAGRRVDRTARAAQASCGGGGNGNGERKLGAQTLRPSGLVGADPPHREPVPGRRHWAGQRGEESRKVQEHCRGAQGTAGGRV